jgi:hypothetical protein
MQSASSVQPRPTLLNSCAWAATAAEARFRINTYIVPTRHTRVVALDAGAVPVVRRVSEQPWADAKFFIYEPGPASVSHNGGSAEIRLRRLDGSDTRLTDELTGAGVAVMVATADDAAAGATAIGDECTIRGIMTAGLVLGEQRHVGAAVSALRPHARVLMVTADEHDVSEVLAALRA